MTTQEYEAKKGALLAEIEGAFGSVIRDEGIIESIKNLSPYSFAAAKRQLLDMGNRWQDIPDQWLQEERFSTLIHLDAHSFRYYLPAYLSWFLRFMDYEAEFDEYFFRSSTFYSVLFILTVYEKRADGRVEKYHALSPQQAEVVAHFLVFQCERLIFLYEREESEDPNSTPEFQGYRGEHGYKNLYNQLQMTLRNHWGQFLGSDFVQPDFPYVAERRRWREIWKAPDPAKREAYETKKASLIAEIERVFDGVQREDGMTIHEAHALDDYADAEEQAKARLLDTETRWQDVPDEAIKGTQWGLSILDARGFHYYFPAYLIWCLRFADSEEEGADTTTMEAVDFLLDIRSYEGKDFSLYKQFLLFSEKQKRTVAHFVQFQHERWDYMQERWNFTPTSEIEDEQTPIESPHADIQRALDNYWSQFL